MAGKSIGQTTVSSILSYTTKDIQQIDIEFEGENGGGWGFFFKYIFLNCYSQNRLQYMYITLALGLIAITKQRKSLVECRLIY